MPNPDMLTQTIRDLLEENTRNNNPVSYIDEVDIVFDEDNKMLIEVGTISNKKFRVTVEEEKE